MSLPWTTLPADAQEESPYTESIEVRVANIDVVVTDKAGRRVLGLTAEDFELRENGVVRPVTNFYEVIPPRGAASESFAIGSAVAPAVGARRPSRTIVLIDEGSVEPHRRQQLLDSLQIFCDATQGAGDEVMLATWHRGLKVRLPFTSDPALLKEAIATVREDLVVDSLSVPHQRDEVERRVEMEIELVRMGVQSVDQAYAAATAHARVFSDQIRRRTREIAKAIEALMKTMAGTEGRKSFVFVSGQFPTYPGHEYFAYINATIVSMMLHPIVVPPESISGNEGDLQAAIARTANAHGVGFYGISASTDWDGTGVSSREAKQKLPSVEFATFTNTSSALQTISRRTGGVTMIGGTNFLGALAKVWHDMNAYYSLGYRPSAKPGQESRVTVRVKRPGLRVRARSSTIGLTSSDEVASRLVGNLLVEGAPSDFAISVTTGTPVKERRRLYSIPLEVVIPADEVTLIPVDTRLRGRFSVFVGGRNTRGAVSDVTRKTQDLDIASSDQESLSRKHWTFELSVLVHDDQDALTVAVLDEVSMRTAFATVPIDPDSKSASR